MGKFMLGSFVTVLTAAAVYPWLYEQPAARKAMKCYCKKARHMMRGMF